MSKKSEIGLLLQNPIGRFNADLIAATIDTDEVLFEDLVGHMLSDDTPRAHKASYAFSIITDKYPYLAIPYIYPMIEAIPRFRHPGIVRSVLRYLAIPEIEIPEDKLGVIIEICYQYMQDNEVPAAIRVHAMQIVFNIAQKEPDLKEELRLTLESYYDHGTVGFQNRAGKLLKKLGN